MSYLEQSSGLSAPLPFPPPIPGRIEVSPAVTSNFWRLAEEDKHTKVGLGSQFTAHFGTLTLGGLSSFGGGPATAVAPARSVVSVASRPTTTVAAQPGISLLGQPRVEQIVNVSGEADQFAREHNLFGSLVVIRNLLAHGGSPVLAVDIDLISDPEVGGTPLVCFALSSSASVSDLLDYDERLRGSLCDEIPSSDRSHFAFRFDLE